MLSMELTSDGLAGGGVGLTCCGACVAAGATEAPCVCACTAWNQEYAIEKKRTKVEMNKDFNRGLLSERKFVRSG